MSTSCLVALCNNQCALASVVVGLGFFRVVAPASVAVVHLSPFSLVFQNRRL